MNDDFKIDSFSGQMRVLTSGLMILFRETDSAKFDLQIEDFNFSVIISFSKDNSKERMLSLKTEDSTIRLLCKNFDAVLGSGTAKPIELAVVNGKKVYVHFWTSLPNNDATHQIMYSFYMEARDGRK